MTESLKPECQTCGYKFDSLNIASDGKSEFNCKFTCRLVARTNYADNTKNIVFSEHVFKSYGITQEMIEKKLKNQDLDSSVINIYSVLRNHLSKQLVSKTPLFEITRKTLILEQKYTFKTIDHLTDLLSILHSRIDVITRLLVMLKTQSNGRVIDTVVNSMKKSKFEHYISKLMTLEELAIHLKNFIFGFGAILLDLYQNKSDKAYTDSEKILFKILMLFQYNPRLSINPNQIYIYKRYIPSQINTERENNNNSSSALIFVGTHIINSGK